MEERLVRDARERPYLMVPKMLIEDRTVSADALRLYLIIGNLLEDYDNVSVDDCADRAGLSREDFARIAEQLRLSGWASTTKQENGTTYELVDKYIERCAAELESSMGPYKPTPKQDPVPEPPRIEYVYLIKSDRGYHKIGRTKNLKDRMKTFGIQLPFEIEFVHVIETFNCSKAEAVLHEQFADKRVNGEWFNLSAEDVEDIKAIKSL